VLPRDAIGAEGAGLLAGWCHLTRLDVYGNLVGPQGLAGLAALAPVLRSLDLGDCQLGAGGLAHVARLTGLRSLGVALNGLGARDLAPLAQLTMLTHLDASHNRIGPEGAELLARLTGLRALDVLACGLLPRGAVHLLALSLEHLSIDPKFANFCTVVSSSSSRLPPRPAEVGRAVGG
jgi:hypothetical protein